MNTKLFGRIASPAFAASMLVALAPATAHAGFLDQLFGGGAPQQAPSYGYEQPQQYVDQPIYAAPMPAPVEVHRVKKHVALNNKPVLQKTTDLMHDATLRPGDAVMMKDGLHVYEGAESSRHHSDEFVALGNDDDLTGKERAKLVQMDTTRNDPLRGEITPDTIASGRSASVATPIVAGYKITDARGMSVRYVGP